MSLNIDVLVDDLELVESAYVPVEYPVPDKAGFDEVVAKNICISFTIPQQY